MVQNTLDTLALASSSRAVTLSLAVTACSAHLEQVLGHVDADEGGRAPHAGQVVCQHVAPHFEVVDQHGGHAGRGREAAARHNHDVNLRAWRVTCVTRAQQAGSRGAKEPPRGLYSCILHKSAFPPTRCTSGTPAPHACRLKASLRRERRHAPAKALQRSTEAGAGDLAASAASFARNRRGERHKSGTQGRRGTLCARDRLPQAG